MLKENQFASLPTVPVLTANPEESSLGSAAGIETRRNAVYGPALVLCRSALFQSRQSARSSLSAQL
jgi:hypothetical protein